jgi:NTE family protein
VTRRTAWAVCRRWSALFPLLALGIVLSLPVQSATVGGRPRIGLALGGGGARGAAHVGVLRVLESLRIPVDYIAGTSMGAIVGGLYAMGMTPDEIERAIEGIDWDDIFDDDSPRPERRFRRKEDDRRFPIRARPGVIESERRVELVPALIQGQKLQLALRRYTLPASGVRSFDDLRLPFRAVATDVVTGDAVLLDHGDLATAIRASMAVPAIFAPVEIEDRLLVDGGLAMNLPVAAVRAMGADIVIAVDVGGPRRGREEIGNVLAMLDQVASLVTWRNTQQEIASLRPRDRLIEPPLGREVLSTDFNNMATAIRIGQQGAEAKRAELAPLGLSPARYADYLARRRPPDFALPKVAFVRLENSSGLADSKLRSLIQVRPGDTLDPAAIERQLGQIHDLDNFESVSYRLEGQGGQTGVVVTAREKSWGTSHLQGLLELSSASGGDSMFNLGAAYTMTPLNGYNGEWRTLLQIGQDPAIITELYQPLDAAERWFVHGGLGYLSNNLRLYADESQDTPVAEYQLTRTGGTLRAGRNLADWGRVGLGYSRYFGSADLRIAEPSYQGFSYDVGELDVRLAFDTLDSLNFPRRGVFGQVFGVSSRGWLGASNDYDQAGVEVLKAGSWGRDSLIGGLSLGGNLGGDTPLQAYYQLGGFLHLSGFNQDALAGPFAGLARGVYLRDLGTSLIRTYAGASLELGNTWQTRGEIAIDDTHLAGSVFAGADTILGPLYVGIGLADGGNTAFYLFLGRPWMSELRAW